MENNSIEGSGILESNVVAGRAGATPTAASTSRLDMDRVKRWAELLAGDPQARDYMRAQLAGSELEQLAQLMQRSQRLELALKHGIPPQLAEVHLTAADPQLLEAQAESLARILGAAGSLPAYAPEGKSLNSSSIHREDEQSISGPAARYSAVSPLPTYEAAPVNGEQWLEQQFVRMYEQ